MRTTTGEQLRILHALKDHIEETDPVAWRCRVAGGEYVMFPNKRCRFCQPLFAAPQPQPNEPEGWRLVPIEPLINMMSDKDHDTRIIAERQLLTALSAYTPRLPEQPKPRPYDYDQAHRHSLCNHGPERTCGQCKAVAND